MDLGISLDNERVCTVEMNACNFRLKWSTSFIAAFEIQINEAGVIIGNKDKLSCWIYRVDWDSLQQLKGV